MSQNDPAWFRRVQSLVLSVRCFGGRLSEARFIVNFVGDVAPEFRAALRTLGADVRVVERLGRAGGLEYMNKLRMLELHEEAEFDVLVALDCDLVVVADFRRHVPASSIGAKPADHDFFTERQWRRLYETVELRPPARTLRASSSGKAIGPYFNSGVLTVPRAACGELRRQWETCSADLTAMWDPGPRLRGYLQDQAALSLAIASARLPWVALPVAMNFPCHVPVHRSVLESSPSPAILHYHDRIDDQGFLLRPICEAAADSAHRFNSTRAERLSLPYAGLRRTPAWERWLRNLRGRVRRTLQRGHGVRNRIRDSSARRSWGATP